jgi:predicted negative regulator of RcsB-dependent stress response
LEEAQKEQTQLEALSQMSNQLKILIAVGIILAIGITFIGVSNLMCEPPCV